MIYQAYSSLKTLYFSKEKIGEAKFEKEYEKNCGIKAKYAIESSPLVKLFIK